MSTTNAMRYADEILYNVRDVIWNIKERGGLINQRFLNAEYQRLQGEYPEIFLNVALLAIGKPKAFQGGRFELTDVQYASLVERAKERNRVELAQIAQMRAEIGK